MRGVLKMTDFNIILFDKFEILDPFGPAEVIGYLPDSYRLRYFSLNGGHVQSSQLAIVDTLPFSVMDTAGILLIPGGSGIRALVKDEQYIEKICSYAEKAPYVLTVCNGSALLAKTGLLDEKRATGYKAAFDWVCSNRHEVKWAKKARWVKDGKFYSSSGISAGIDMILGFVRDMHGMEAASAIAWNIEYIWNADMENDPFAVE
jgi:transcriptional regulator GlxA family with amidase domain